MMSQKRFQRTADIQVAMALSRVDFFNLIGRLILLYAVYPEESNSKWGKPHPLVPPVFLPLMY